MNFSNILNINFTFVFPSCKCVMLQRDISFWDIFFVKKEFKFLNYAFLLRNCEILSVFQGSFTSLRSAWIWI
jgi:hypothetical protein